MNKNVIATNKNIKAFKTAKEVVLSQVEDQLTAAQTQVLVTLPQQH